MKSKNLIFAISFTLLGFFIGFYANQKMVSLAENETIENMATQNVAAKNEGVKNEGLQNGDLIFQTSVSGQSKAIQLATKSKYSHCGIIYKEGEDFYVFEAVQPVKRTPLKAWIARGQGGKYVVKRLKNAAEVLTPVALKKMKAVGEQFKAKNYDLVFEWSDEKIYCSELIWKIYKRATGLEIGRLQKLGDFDLSHAIVRQKMKARYGDNIPLAEVVISPAAIFESELLVTVEAN